MNKKVVILTSLLILVFSIIGGYLIVSNKDNDQSLNSLDTNEKALVTKEAVAGDLEYSDSSGFSFMYPESVKVTDITPSSDDSYYSKLSLTKGNSKLLITVRDEKSKTVEDFIKSDASFANYSLIGASSIGGISAKEYSSSTNKITLALKDGIMYLIEGDKDGGFWESLQDVVVSSFSFGEKKTTVGNTSSDDDNTLYEAEEVVE